MIRLHALVEGQTEEAFFNSVLAVHLQALDIQADVQLINPKLNSPSRRNKGGWTSYDHVKRHLHRWMKGDCAEDVWYTTMFDLYAIPADFPRLDEAKRIADPLQRVQFLEAAFHADIVTDTFWRFIPYIQLHEFEALLLADPQKLDWEFLEHDEAISALIAEAGGFEFAESINGDPLTAPSKRIIARIPEYKGRKASAGPLVARKIGLPVLRDRCRHFGDWVGRLESLTPAPAPPGP